MNISPVSFGAKIPVAKCQVINRENNEPTEATLYEYDCKDIEDIFEVGDLKGNWEFQDYFTLGMHGKFLNMGTAKELPEYKYYCLKNSDDEMLGICKTKEVDNSIDIALINTERKKYKYSGQAIIASLAKKLIESSGNILRIKSVIEDARGFYSDACGFNDVNIAHDVLGWNYEINKNEIEAFIERIEDKTQGEIINLSV